MGRGISSNVGLSCFLSAGTQGALPRVGCMFKALEIAVRSTLDTAAERRWAWWRFPEPPALNPGPGAGSFSGHCKGFSSFNWFVSATGGLTRRSPPTNSLGRRRCPLGLADDGPVVDGCGGGGGGGGDDDDDDDWEACTEPGLKENAGSAGGVRAGRDSKTAGGVFGGMFLE